MNAGQRRAQMQELHANIKRALNEWADGTAPPPAPLPPLEQHYTVRQCVKISGLSEPTIWIALRDKRLRSVKVRGRRLVTESALRDYLAGC